MESINKIRLASTLTFDSIVDGPGLRIVLWTQGCPHHCKGCHNPQTHDINGGKEFLIDDLIKQIQNSNLQNGITFSGGEPFLQSKALLPIAKAVHAMGLNVWAFSGYTWEQLIRDPDKKALLEEIDVLVDGPFVEELKNYQLYFKGSSNQRIIDVPKTLEENKIILSEYESHNQ